MNSVFHSRRTALLLVGPALLVYTLITLIPIFWSFGYTFFSGGLIQGFTFSGLKNFQTFFTVAQDLVGEEKAREIAFEIGRRYGGQGYAKLLASEGKESGEPRDMALYQDLVHSIRGPKHASALFAEHNDSRCVVKRQECIYYSEEHPENGQYTGAFESGCFEGYKQADPNLLRVEVHHCRWKGDGSCEQHWVYQEDGTQPPETVV